MSQKALSEIIAALERIDAHCRCGSTVEAEIRIIRNNLLPIGVALASKTTGDKIAIGQGSTAIENVVNTIADSTIQGNTVQAGRIGEITNPEPPEI